MILQQRHCPTKRQHYPTTWRDILHRHFFCKKTFFTRTTKISAFRSNGGKSITWKMYSRYIVYTSMHFILAGPICHVHTRLWAAPEVDKVPWSPSSPPVLPPAGPKNSHPCPATKASAGWDMFNTLLLKNVERCWKTQGKFVVADEFWIIPLPCQNEGPIPPLSTFIPHQITGAMGIDYPCHLGSIKLYPLI